MEKFIGVARRWYQKAVDSNDSFDQFISIWISFNAIYGRRDGSEFRKIKSIINEFNSDTITSILAYEEVRYFYTISPPIQFLNMDLEIEDTADAQNKLNRNINRSPKIALENLMYILNKVRNNLFHGDKRIERARDVDIVKNAYPIVKEIVKSYLRLDYRLEPINNGSVSATDNSIENILTDKIDTLKEQISNLTNHYSTLPKDHKHPVSILLDRINMQANGIEPGFTTPQQLEAIQQNLLKLYEQNKPDVLKDTEEVFNFVNNRMREVIDNGCTEEDVNKFYNEYIELQRKYLDKGYDLKFIFSG
ncbi:hypothetical protein QNH48_28390 [Neobacillus sp. YX16]|uniref:methylamine utilization protein MauJ n=1 Tax=Neobacillus sp. YX16 TaxID=3047874 RepID=UPI0024C2441A|nr:methylamine utilization protein MauJ [Neobacillus sp. YX16]WHZ02793.1 hypothetical protein QNH48_28390 [Neobacillus sp. YX16]